MMADSSPSEGELSPRDLLSREEMRELLSPLSYTDGEEGDPVLLVSGRPEDATSLSEILGARGVSMVPARNRFSPATSAHKEHYSG